MHLFEKKLEEFRQYTLAAFPVIEGRVPEPLKTLAQDTNNFLNFVEQNGENKTSYTLTDICKTCDLNPNNAFKLGLFLCNTKVKMFKPVFFDKKERITKAEFNEKILNKNEKENLTFSYELNL